MLLRTRNEKDVPHRPSAAHRLLSLRKFSPDRIVASRPPSPAHRGASSSGLVSEAFSSHRRHLKHQDHRGTAGLNGYDAYKHVKDARMAPAGQHMVTSPPRRLRFVLRPRPYSRSRRLSPVRCPGSGGLCRTYRCNELTNRAKEGSGACPDALGGDHVEDPPPPEHQGVELACVLVCRGRRRPRAPWRRR